jgi:hypothetical protein
MKKLIKLFLLFCFTKIDAQVNLIPNPSFEEDTACPNQISQIYKLKDWYSVNTTPDYFNKCYYGVSNNASIPKNAFGYQDVNFGCHSYIGINHFGYNINSTNNEMIGVKINTPLSVNTKYYFSLKTSLANQSRRAGNKLGVNFYLNKPPYTPTINPTNAAQITFTQTVIDTSNWISLFSSFTPTLAYEFLTIGNFYDTLNFSRTFLYNEISPNIYYYIDDVCLSTDSTFAYNYSYNCLITDIFKNEKDNFFILPNPSKNRLSISSNNEINEIKLLNLNSIPQLIYRKENEIEFDLKTGIYFLQVKLADKYYYKKIIINN